MFIQATVITTSFLWIAFRAELSTLWGWSALLAYSTLALFKTKSLVAAELLVPLLQLVNVR